jgi:AcrR family transcriptional regulator
MTTPRRPTLRQEQQAATRQRLLQAAHHAFIELGFTATTVESIVDAANTSRATFYLHFKNKTDALLATWREFDLPEVDNLFRQFDEAGDFTPGAAQAWLERVVSYWEQHGSIGRTALQALSLEPDLESVWIEGMVAIVDDMRNFRAKFGDDQVARAVILTNVIELERVLYFWASSRLPCSRESLIKALVRNWSTPES